MADPGPLAGLRVIITRPAGQATPLAHSIDQAGGSSILLPLLTIKPPADIGVLHNAIARLAEFDLAIFISPSAVEHGLPPILAAGPIPARLKFAAVGQGSARTLKQMGIINVIAPVDRFDSESLLAQPELQDVRGRYIAIFRGDHGRELLGDTLRQRGAFVEYVPCYVRARAPLDINALINANADALIITSSEALTYLCDALGSAGIDRLAGVTLFAQHPRIAQTAVSRGWHQVILTEDGDEGLLAGLITWSAKRL